MPMESALVETVTVAVSVGSVAEGCTVAVMILELTMETLDRLTLPVATLTPTVESEQNPEPDIVMWYVCPETHGEGVMLPIEGMPQ